MHRHGQTDHNPRVQGALINQIQGNAVQMAVEIEFQLVPQLCVTVDCLLQIIRLPYHRLCRNIRLEFAEVFVHGGDQIAQRVGIALQAKHHVLNRNVMFVTVWVSALITHVALEFGAALNKLGDTVGDNDLVAGGGFHTEQREFAGSDFGEILAAYLPSPEDVIAKIERRGENHKADGDLEGAVLFEDGGLRSG